MRLFRQGPTPGFDPTGTGGNTTGFLRAFSDNPNAFASGFNRIEKVMKALRVRRLMLFPRFHQSVKDSLETHAPEVCVCVGGGWAERVVLGEGGRVDTTPGGVRGCLHTGRRMRRLVLFPRFHQSVKDSLEAHALEVGRGEI